MTVVPTDALVYLFLLINTCLLLWVLMCRWPRCAGALQQYEPEYLRAHGDVTTSPRHHALMTKLRQGDISRDYLLIADERHIVSLANPDNSQTCYLVSSV